MKKEYAEKNRRIRVRFEYADDEFLYVRSSDDRTEYLKVRYHVEGLNNEFNDNIPLFWRGASLNLLDCTMDELGICSPSFIVLEPDYLLDISSLAECYRDYGSHPANYVMNRLMPIENVCPLLIGNIANFFLDEWIYADKEMPNYMSAMKKVFKQYPIELAACEELQDPVKEREFFADCNRHFKHISEIVLGAFNDSIYQLDKRDAVLEPSYICEALGIQGRLDYMQRDMRSFIEMKSGKADEYSDKSKILPKENNRAQMLLYMAILEYSMGCNHKQQHPYLLYTRYPLLYPARISWANVKKIIALRNRIVAAEYGVQAHNNLLFTEKLLSQINPFTLNQRKLRGRFWEQYLEPQIQNFQNKLTSLSSLEKDYFYTFYNFISKELYLSKIGGINDGNRIGMAALWLHSLREKREAGEILYDLRLIDNQASRLHAPIVTFHIPKYDEEYLPNFRNGDAVVLYERNTETDKVTNQMVFKGNVEDVTDEVIRVRLRARQRNKKLFPVESLYAIEHDSMDTSFRSMYYGLSAFLNANKDRKDLLLGQREPKFKDDVTNACLIDDFERVVRKSLLAEDYFLLVGPPGTGKTSRALNQMVRTFYESPKTNILLLAYTNRAVDEICQSLSTIVPKVDYLRVGSELSCASHFRDHLLENALDECKNRRDVLRRVSACRIYVGTVAAISSKMEIFKVKHFNVAIIDEATQILESHLLGILCAKSPEGGNAIDKFVLIGDHKQLPAIVLQEEKCSEVRSKELRSLGLLNLKESLFERLYRFHLNRGDKGVMDMLIKQGRMHPDVSKFVNEAFYGNKLLPVGLPHQLETLINPIVFVPSRVDTISSDKANYHEAVLVAEWALRIWSENITSFDVNRTLGIITPYRNQIALIRKELQKHQIPALMKISVDTVERYQGSERDIIIYSFCVNNLSQLHALPNLIEENGVVIDRKLNVVLTRARKKLIIVGNPDLLKHNSIYARLLDSIK